MPSPIRPIPLMLALAAPAAAQDLVFDESSLLFDTGGSGIETPTDATALAFDEASLDFDAATAPVNAGPTRRGPDWQLSYSLAATRAAGTFNRDMTLGLTAANSGTVAGIGHVEWQLGLTGTNLSDTPAWSIEIDRLVIQNSSGDLSWKIGRYPIGWGEIEGVPVLDVINSGLSLADLGSATEDLPGQWFVSLDRFGQTATASAFVNLDPAVSHAAPTTIETAGFEAGARLSVPTASGQVSAYAARLLPQAGVVDFSGVTSSARAYTLVGASGHRAAGPFLIEADLALKLGLERATASGYATDNRVDLAIGAEWAVSGTTQVTGSLALQHWLDGSPGYFDYGPGGPVAASRTSASYLLSISTASADATVDGSAFLGGSADGSTGFLALQAAWAPSDRVELSASWSLITAAPGSLLAPLDNSSSLSVEASYRF